MLSAIQHGTAQVNGVELHYAEAGSGKLMLFVHGFPEFWYAWTDQLMEFGRDHHAVAFDTRGVNESSKPEGVENYRVEKLIGDIKGMIEHFGAEKCVLVGHDWGGVACWAFAIKHPEMLERLIIVNAPHPGVFAELIRNNAAQQEASQYINMFRTEGSENVLAQDEWKIFRESILEPLERAGHLGAEDVQRYLDAWSTPGAMKAALNYYRAMDIRPPGKDRAAEAPSGGADSLAVKCPVTVIWGLKDTALLPGNIEGLEAYIPDLEIYTIPEGSHWVVHEHGSEVNALIRQALRDW
jgi:pimeloyl-ACP methyl ester carboxylesterase